MRLVASYHGVYEVTEFEDRWSDVHDWYERATLPIELGGMAIRNMGLNLSKKSLNVYWDAARVELTQPCITTLFFIRLGTEIGSQLFMFIQELGSQPGFRLKFLRCPISPPL